MNSCGIFIEGDFALLANDLLRFFRFKLKGEHWADDLAQETLLRLHQAQQTGPIENQRAMAFRIAENLLIDHQRKQQVRLAVAAHDEVDFDAIRCPKPSPEKILDQRARLLRLRNILGKLPSECRTVFIMSRIKGLSHAQIAAQLGVSESTVAKHLSLAMRHCRDRLRDE